MAAKNSNIPEGTLVSAPHPKYDGEVHRGRIENNLSAMYFIAFNNGTFDFVFKAEDVRRIED